MGSTFMNIAVFLQTSQGNVDGVASTVRPWQQNFLIDAVAVAFGLGLIVLTWLWARSGRTKRENEVPFERTAEDFAGTIQAGYGQLPAFLIVVYVMILIFIVAYTANAILTGVQY